MLHHVHKVINMYTKSSTYTQRYASTYINICTKVYVNLLTKIFTLTKIYTLIDI